MSITANRILAKLYLVRRLLFTVMFLGGGCLGIWLGVVDYLAFQPETAPTVFAVDDFHNYHGQRWLTLEKGMLAMNHTVSRPTLNNPGSVEYYVPLVPADWQPTQPVHAIILIGPIPEAVGPQYLKEKADGTMHPWTGIALNHQTGPLAPELIKGEPIVVVQLSDKSPDTSPPIALIIVGVCATLIGVVFAIVLYFNLRKLRSIGA